MQCTDSVSCSRVMEVNRNRTRYHGRSTLAQVLVSVIVHTQNINIGVMMGMSVFVIGALRMEADDLSFTKEQASWFGGIVFVVHPVGGLMYSLMRDTLSRKTFMINTNVPQFLAYLMMYYSTSVYHLLAAQAIIGMSIGFMKAPLLAYLGEGLQPRLRGTLVSLNGLFLNLGMFLATVIGASTDWRTMTLYVSAMPLISFLSLSIIPNSPAWLVLKGRVDDAEKAFQWLRGWVPAIEVQEELDALVKYVKDKPKDSEELKLINSIEVQNIEDEQPVRQSNLQLFLHPSVQRPLRLVFVYMMTSFCVGLQGIRQFFIEVAPQITLPISAEKALVILNAVTMLGSSVATLGMRRLGKRGLTFLSLTLTTSASLGLGLYVLLGCRLTWAPIVLLGLTYFGGQVGLYTVSWVLISEIFPLRMRSAATGVATALSYVIVFIVVMSFYSIVSLVNLWGAFFFYGSVGLLGFIYLYFRLPETEGIRLEEIETFFKTGKVSDNRHDNCKI